MESDDKSDDTAGILITNDISVVKTENMTIYFLTQERTHRYSILSMLLIPEQEF